MLHRNDAVKILHLKAAIKAGGRANSERKGQTHKRSLIVNNHMDIILSCSALS